MLAALTVKVNLKEPQTRIAQEKLAGIPLE
jgi:hypothetical protein